MSNLRPWLVFTVVWLLPVAAANCQMMQFRLEPRSGGGAPINQAILGEEHRGQGNHNWQIKAIELAPENQQTEFRSRLELYKAGKPYRDPPKP